MADRPMRQENERLPLGHCKESVDRKTWKRFKSTCKKRGLKMGWVLKELINEWVSEKERKEIGEFEN